MEHDVQLGCVHRDLGQQEQPGQEADHHGEHAVDAGAGDDPLQVDAADELQQEVGRAAEHGPGEQRLPRLALGGQDLEGDPEHHDVGHERAGQQANPRDPAHVGQRRRQRRQAGRAQQERAEQRQAGQRPQPALHGVGPIEQGHGPGLVQGLLGCLHGAQAGPEGTADTDDQRPHVPLDRTDVAPELVADHRELTERSVDQVLLEVGPVGQDEAEDRHEGQEEREEGQEAVVGDERRQRAGVVVAELLHDREWHGGHGVTLLEAVELANRTSEPTLGLGRLGGGHPRFSGRRWHGRGPVPPLEETGDGGHHDEDGPDDGAQDAAFAVCWVGPDRHGRAVPGQPALGTTEATTRFRHEPPRDPGRSVPEVNELGLDGPGSGQTSAAASPLPEVSVPSGWNEPEMLASHSAGSASEE